LTITPYLLLPEKGGGTEGWILSKNSYFKKADKKTRKKEAVFLSP